MITLKYWNSLSQNTRNEICNALGTSGKVAEEYHHNFDFDALGAKVKNVLESCNLQKDGTINVVVKVTPIIASKSTAKATAKTAPKATAKAVRKVTKADFATYELGCQNIKKYLDTKKEVRVRGKFDWNNRIEGFCLNNNGSISIEIYWQGDSTDGSDYVSLSEVISAISRRGEYVIPAEKYFDGYRTRTTHGDLRIKKSDLEYAFAEIAESL